MNDIIFYCGVNEKIWNYHPVSPGKYACISPVFGNKISNRQENKIKIPDYTKVIQDSGAFSDGPSMRLSFEGALERQISHAHKYEYADQVTHIASYDLLIDEKWSSDGNRYKERWDENDAWEAVDITTKAAEYISSHRKYLSYGNGLILSAQGVSPLQYLECVKQVVPYMNLETDIFGLGGWCITGKHRKSMLPILKETMSIVIPYLGDKGIKKVHIWGVIFAPALGKLLWECDKYRIQVSTDSAGPQFRPAFGSWGYADWRDNTYKRPETSIRGQERERHVNAVRDWLNEFRKTQYYKGE